MRIHFLAAIVAFVICLQPTSAAESKALKRASLAATEQLFSEPRILDITIDVPQAQLEALKREPRVYVKATVRDGTNVLENAGFRFKGTNTSLKTSRPGFTLKFNEFITDQRFYGQRKLGFESSEQDPSYLGEFIANELFRSAGIPTPRNTFARIKLNGKDVGLYVLSEGINKDFLDRHFDKSKGNLYEGDGTDITDKLDNDSDNATKDQADLKALADAAKDSNLEQRWKKLQAVLDVDRFITFAAMEVLLGHTNGYVLGKSRYRIFHDPVTDRLVFMPHSIENVFTKPDAPAAPEMKALLAKAILETPEGKKRYRDEMAKLLSKTFKLEMTQARVNELAAKLKPALKDAAPAQDQAVKDLLDRITARHKSLQQQLKQS